MPIDSEFQEENYSYGFNIDGVEIEQTISQSFDPFSGLDIDTSIFQNTNQSLLDSNQDGRIPLGCFVFDEDNQLSDNFIDTFSPIDKKFIPIKKRNLIPNGSGKGVHSTYKIYDYFNAGEKSALNDYGDGDIRMFLPLGGWGYCTFDSIQDDYKVRQSDLYTDSNLNQNRFEDYSSGRIHLQSFEQSTYTADGTSQEGITDYHNTTGSSGFFAYCFDYPNTMARPQVHLDLIKRGYKNWVGGSIYKTIGEMGDYSKHTKADEYSSQYDSDGNPIGQRPKSDCDEFFYRLADDAIQELSYVTGDLGRGIVTPLFIPTIGQTISPNPNAPEYTLYPNIAKWITTTEAYSHNRCLEFLAVDLAYTVFYKITGKDTFNQGSGISHLWNDDTYQPHIGSYTDNNYNQYKTLNQVIQIPPEEITTKHTIYEIKFKMKTDSRFFEQEYPEVELCMQDSDGTLSDPKRTQDREYGSNNYGYYQSHGYWPEGEFNSQRYNDDLNTSNTSVNRKYSGFGSMGRFRNTELDTWEEFSYTFSSGRYFHYSYAGGRNRNIYFMVQTAGNFKGRVLLDDFELIESYDFIPDVDVRKKLSAGTYGKADLTKYYDKELQPEQYKDSQAPLEAQFYFYPTYKTDETFDVSRTPMYRDFKNGLFYIYDIDWGDGSPKEFTSKPELINEEKALYHTYTKNGIFEVTGTMIRTKPDRVGQNSVGIAKNKKFRLRICVNKGTAEDFDYFGGDGFSFIPYKNNTPIIGGISKQSLYYKSIKRQLGLIGDTEINIPFKYDGDRLKTEIAFDEMDESFNNKLNLLNEYKQTRVDENDEVIFNGLKLNTDELGKGIGDLDITNIKYYDSPKEMWQILGFDNSFTGLPTHERYWKNIIPKDYSIFNREGLDNKYINVESEQDWLDDYYYPVLPKYGANGLFVDGDFPNNKIPFAQEGFITTEDGSDMNLLIFIKDDNLENNILNDNSGNNNFGIMITDYKPEFNEKTLAPTKTKKTKKIRTSTNNGAF